MEHPLSVLWGNEMGFFQTLAIFWNAAVTCSLHCRQVSPQGKKYTRQHLARGFLKLFITETEVVSKPYWKKSLDGRNQWACKPKRRQRACHGNHWNIKRIGKMLKGEGRNSIRRTKVIRGASVRGRQDPKAKHFWVFSFPDFLESWF